MQQHQDIRTVVTFYFYRLQDGDTLDVTDTGGVHTNKKTMFVRLTPQMVCIRIS